MTEQEILDLMDKLSLTYYGLTAEEALPLINSNDIPNTLVARTLQMYESMLYYSKK